MKGYKKTVSLILSLVVILTGAFVYAPVKEAVAAEKKSFTGTISANPNEDITVLVNITGNPGILGATITVSYSSKLSLTGSKKGEAFNVLSFTEPGEFSNPCNFVWDGEKLTADQIKDGTILELYFTAADSVTAGEKLDVTVSYNSGAIRDTKLKVVNPELTVAKYDPEATCDHSTTKVVNEMVSTCNKHGYTGDVVCAKCGKEISKGQELPFGEHNYVAVVTPPTPLSKGYTTYTCSVCSHSYIDSYTDYIYDEDTPQIIVSNTRARAGETISLDVSLKNNPGFCAFSLSFDYDTSRLTLKEVELNPAIGGIFNYKKNAVWSGGKDIETDIDILTLTFDVLPEAEVGSAYVNVVYQKGDISNYAEEDVEFTVQGGSVKVISYIPGDINNDGEVSPKDLTRFVKYFSGESDPVVENALDVNADGVVNTKDLTRLVKYLSGEDVEIY